MNDVDRTKHVLPDAENLLIFNTDIVRRHLQGTRQEHPVAVIVAGQTGAGKTGITSIVQHTLDQRGSWVNINLDTLKPYHPQHARLMAENDLTAGAYTSIDGHKWMDRSEAYAIAQRLDIVWESAMRDERDFEDPARRMRAARPDGLPPHRLEVAIVAVPAAISRLGALQRYMQQVEDFGVGRFIDPAIHDACYDGVIRSSHAIDAEHLADRVIVVRRDATVVYSNGLKGDGTWERQPDTAGQVAAERERRWSPGENHVFNLATRKVEQAAERLPAADRAAVLAELTTIRGLAAPLLASAPTVAAAARSRSTSVTPKQITAGAGAGRPDHRGAAPAAPAPGHKPRQR